jgi:hypothetical protein
MRGILPTAFFLLAGAVEGGYVPPSLRPGSIFKRADSDSAICEDLSVSSNNGNRKVAIVIDQSSSMQSSDPNRDSVRAARELNDFLVEAEKPDKVAVVGFDSTGSVEYSLGDPAAAGAALDGVVNTGGGTYIGLTRLSVGKAYCLGL